LIVPQNNVAGVHLLMSRAGVEHVLGAPRSLKVIGDARRMDYGRTKVYLSLTEDGTVFRVTTTDRRQRTATGVRVGSSAAAVRRGVSGVRCSASACVVGSARAGQRVTTFTLRSGRVARVTLGFYGAT
jgi:hypothetical protein